MSPFDAQAIPETARARVGRHLREAVAALERGDLATAVQAARAAADEPLLVGGPSPAALHLAPDGQWFVWAGARVDLARRGSLRRILVALADAAQLSPGMALPRDALLEAGWPGERMRSDSGAMRVHTAVARLRRAGLGTALLTRDDGYLIDPRVAVRRQSPG